MEELNAIEHLHADRIDRIDRYINEKWGGEIDLRTVIVLVIKDLQGECERLRAFNAELVAALDRAAWALERIGTHIASLAEIDPDDKWIECGELVKNEAAFARAALAKAKEQ